MKEAWVEAGLAWRQTQELGGACNKPMRNDVGPGGGAGGSCSEEETK